MNEENHVLTIKTVQIQPIRNLTTALKDILTDATIVFTKDGMKISNFDKTHTMLVNVYLNAKKFEYYNCVPGKIVVCTNTMHFFKLISTLSNDDTLTIYIDKEDYQDGIVSYLGMEFDNRNVGQTYDYKLRLIEPDTEEMEIPEVKYTTIINLPTADFQKIIRDLNAITDRVEIKSVGDDLIFSCVGTFAKTKFKRSESDRHMDFVVKPDSSVVIQGEFSVKSLNNFIKCTPLCTNLEMYLANDLPLIVKYDVASLGEIKLVLAPLPPM
jgi:proliferating cell nuclear antigen